MTQNQISKSIYKCATCTRLKRIDTIRGQEKANYKKYRDLVINGYGGKCIFCGSVDRLHIDHVNGDGAKDRKLNGNTGTSALRIIVKNSFPKEYQLLCDSCNYAKGQRTNEEFIEWVDWIYEKMHKSNEGIQE